MLPKPVYWSWEALASVVSFGAFKASRAAFKRRLASKTAQPGWRLFDRHNLPHMIDRLELTGPRWNTHAVIAFTALPVEERIELALGVLERSAEAWTLSVYRDQSVPVYCATGEPATTRSWALAPGDYTLVIRYYRPRPGARLPSVIVDGHALVPEADVPDDVLDFYHELIRYQRPRHRVWHHYVYPMLRARRYLPEAFVRREFLPVGDRGTQFLFDAFEGGAALEVLADRSVLDDFLVYFTAYDRASFPVGWFEVSACARRTRPLAHDGFWLIRAHPRRGAADLPAERVTVRRVEEQAS
jgi:Family of unknown function (DUF6208)